MNYDDAFNEWAATTIETHWRGNYNKETAGDIDRSTVDVELEVDEGSDCGCCYGRATAEFVFSGKGEDGVTYTAILDADSTSVRTMLAEVLDAGGGTLTR